MKSLGVGRPIIAIEVRRSRFGYAVYQGRRYLADWGASSCPANRKGNFAATRFAELAKLFHPELVVLKQERRGGIRHPEAVAANSIAIQAEAAARSITCLVLSPEQVKTAFNTFAVKTKDDIASILAGFFPELVWELPRKRKRWDNEHPRMATFDAIAIGFAYFELHTSRVDTT